MYGTSTVAFDVHYARKSKPKKARKLCRLLLRRSVLRRLF